MKVFSLFEDIKKYPDKIFYSVSEYVNNIISCRYVLPFNNYNY